MMERKIVMVGASGIGKQKLNALECFEKAREELLNQTIPETNKLFSSKKFKNCCNSAALCRITKDKFKQSISQMINMERFAKSVYSFWGAYINNRRKHRGKPLIRNKALNRARVLQGEYKTYIIHQERSFEFHIDEPDYNLQRSLHVYGASVIQPPKAVFKVTDA